VSTVHLLDAVQYVFDEAMPGSVSAHSAQHATFRYPGFIVSYESRAARGIALHGTKATLRIGRAGCMVFPGGEATQLSADARTAHWSDFLEAIRTRRKPASDIETCVRSTAACLMAERSLTRSTRS